MGETPLNQNSLAIMIDGIPTAQFCLEQFKNQLTGNPSAHEVTGVCQVMQSRVDEVEPGEIVYIVKIRIDASDPRVTVHHTDEDGTTHAAELQVDTT